MVYRDAKVIFKGLLCKWKAAVCLGGVDALFADTRNGDPHIPWEGDNANFLFFGIDGDEHDDICAIAAVRSPIRSEEQDIHLPGWFIYSIIGHQGIYDGGIGGLWCCSECVGLEGGGLGLCVRIQICQEADLGCDLFRDANDGFRHAASSKSCKQAYKKDDLDDPIFLKYHNCCPKPRSSRILRMRLYSSSANFSSLSTSAISLSDSNADCINSRCGLLVAGCKVSIWV